MKTVAIFTVILLFGLNLAAQTPDQPADMKECLDKIISLGMSEVAYQCIAHVAGMRIGGSSWLFKKDETSGIYWNSYAGNRCNKPDQDPEQAEREKIAFEYKLDKEISRLKCLADSDGSGFISSDEGYQFRRLMEFGYKAAFVASSEEGDKQKVSLGLKVELGGSDISLLDEKLKEYSALREKAEKNDIADLPEVVLK